MDLNNKMVIITGGAGGIGIPIVKCLLNKGCSVGVIDNNHSNIQNMLSQIPEENKKLLDLYEIDISDNDDVIESINHFFNKHGHIDILINNAGIIHDGPLIRIDHTGINKYPLEEWNDTLETNLYGQFYVTREVVEKMILKRTHGIIVNVASMATVGHMGQTSYAASKAGLAAMTVCWAQELAPLGIRVAGISPGIINTPMPINSMTDKLIKDWINLTPLKRLGTPEEVCHAVMFILENDFYCGRILEVDGGLRM